MGCPSVPFSHCGPNTGLSHTLSRKIKVAETRWVACGPYQLLWGLD